MPINPEFALDAPLDGAGWGGNIIESFAREQQHDIPGTYWICHLHIRASKVWKWDLQCVERIETPAGGFLF